MKKKSKKKVAESQALTTLLGDTSAQKKPDLLWLFAVRIIFVYMIAVGTIITFVDFYHIPHNLFNIIQQTILMVTAFFPLYVLIKKRYVTPIFLAIGTAIFFFAKTTIIKSVVTFCEFFVLRLDGRLLNTKSLIDPKSVAFLTNTSEFTVRINVALLILIVLISLICVLCCYKKFHPIMLTVSWIILLGPSFFAETADFYPATILLVVGFTGMYTIFSGHTFYNSFVASNVAQANSLTRQDEKNYRKNTKKLSVVEKASSDLNRYGKNNSTAMVATIVTLCIAFLASSAFPNGKFIDYTTFFEYVSNSFYSVMDNVSSWFNVDDNGVFSKYFNSGSSGSSSSLDISAPSTSDREVLKVTVENKEEPIFLRGDIGVDFENNSWTSLQSRENDVPSYKNQFPDIFSDNNLTYKKAFTSFYPEEMTRLFYYGILGFGYNPADYYGCQKINIEYIQNTDVVLIPTSPYELTFKNNNSFNWYGDTVLRVANKSNWVKNYESICLYPYMTEDKINPIISLSDDFTNSNEFLFAVQAYETNGETLLDLNDSSQLQDFIQKYTLNIQEYLLYSECYNQYVNSMYMAVPENELANIEQLYYNYQESDYYDSSNGFSNSNTTRYSIARSLSDYLKNAYTYSLTADNSNPANTMLGNFLFDTKEGHCALYASAMTLALRYAGIPARYVTGFVAGGEYREIDGKYQTTIRDKNLHAWVEVYFENVGWLPFDPTGSAAQLANPAETTTTEETTTPPITEAPITTTTHETSKGETTSLTTTDTTTSQGTQNNFKIDTNVIIIIAIVAAVLLLVLILTMLIRHGIKNEKKRFYRYKTADTNTAVKEMYDFTLKLLSLAGITVLPDETPLEFAARIDKRMYRLDKDINLSETMSVFEQVEFSTDEISEENRKTAYKYVDFLYNETVMRVGKIKRFYYRLTL